MFLLSELKGIKISKPRKRESVMVMSEKQPSRQDLAKYYEKRHPYLSDDIERPKFLAGTSTRSFEVQDSSFIVTRQFEQTRANHKQGQLVSYRIPRTHKSKSKQRHTIYRVFFEER